MARAELADGFIGLCIDPSNNRQEDPPSLLVEGPMLSGTVAVDADTVIRVNAERDIEPMFGVGSVLSETLKVMFCAAPDNVTISAIGREAPAGATAAVYNIAITGTATSDGSFDLYLGDDSYSVAAFVSSGDTAAAIAAKVQAAIPASFPYAATVTGGTVVLTAKNAGAIGNALSPVYNWTGRLNRAPADVSVAITRATDGAGAPAALDYDALVGDCYFDGYVLAFDDQPLERNLRDYIRDKWDCAKPQSFGHGYVWGQGSLGTILARDSNSGELSFLAVSATERAFGWRLAADYGAASIFRTRENPELSVQGPERGILSCTQVPQSCTASWSYDDRVALQAQGFVTYGPATQGSGAYTSYYVHNDVTNYRFDETGKVNVTFRDTNSRRLATRTAIELAAFAQDYNGEALFTRVTDIPEGVQGTNLRLMKADMKRWAKARVGSLFSAFTDWETQLVMQLDTEINGECKGDPGEVHWTFNYRPPVRLSHINSTLTPSLLGDCR